MAGYLGRNSQLPAHGGLSERALNCVPNKQLPRTAPQRPSEIGIQVSDSRSRVDELALAGQARADFVHCTALHYPPGGHRRHVDSFAFGPTVMSLSLAAPAVLQRRPGDDARSGGTHELALARRSLFVLAGEARAAASRWKAGSAPSAASTSSRRRPDVGPSLMATATAWLSRTTGDGLRQPRRRN